MNEVKVTPVTVSTVVRNTSSDGIDGIAKSDKKLPAVGNDLPVSESSVVAKDPSAIEANRGNTEQAVNEVNQFVQSVQRDLHFSVDEDSGLTVIRVRDKESGELIRQIPEDIFLNMAQNLKDTKSIQLLDTHG